MSKPVDVLTNAISLIDAISGGAAVPIPDRALDKSRVALAALNSRRHEPITAWSDRLARGAFK